MLVNTNFMLKNTYLRFKTYQNTNKYFILVGIFCLFSYTCLIAQPIVEKHMVGKKIEGLVKENEGLRMLIVGDWGKNGQSGQQDVADWMGVAAAQIGARFVISTGDNFYPTGVASTDDPQWWFSFENVYRSHSLNVPWYAVLGNHDYNGNTKAQIDYGKKSMRWKMPAPYYTMAQGNVRFVFIDTCPFVKGYQNNRKSYPDLAAQDTTRQLQWIDSVLANSRETWKIVVGHHPVYSIGDHGNQHELHTQFKPILEKYKVQAYFCGHDHNLQYHHLPNTSVHYLVSGAGGAEHTPIHATQAGVIFAKETNGFMTVQVKKETMLVCLIDEKGTIIHQVSVGLKGK
ncbi:MAG: metallophosphoesterase [Verrucomicrobia bacterium]|nr:metallophosphoesterase [Cytophagales bacterium]